MYAPFNMLYKKEKYKGFAYGYAGNNRMYVLIPDLGEVVLAYNKRKLYYTHGWPIVVEKLTFLWFVWYNITGPLALEEDVYD